MMNSNSGFISHFNKPQNIGEISNPDATGTNGSITCGNQIILTAKINKNIISNIRFKTSGCSYTIAALSYLTSLVKNKDILCSTLLTGKEIEKHLGKFPREKKYILNITVNALQNLISDYFSKPHPKNIYKRNERMVAVAMSGGIDSSMAARALKEKGWEVIGVTMKFLPDDFNWKDAIKTCCSPKDIESARKVCLKLGIPHVIINLSKPFEEKIINPFCSEYAQGRTPNPCVDCNKYIKFGSLLEKTKILGAGFIATGHYCSIEKSSDTGLFEVKKGTNKNKDQSYVFWRLNQDQLSKIKTPLGKLSKDIVRKKTYKMFPFLKNKNESQDICFIPGSNYHSFLKQRIKNIKEGDITDNSGNIIGKHKGYPFYTIGQRKGLGISHSKPLYVKEIIPGKNIIVAGEEKDIKRKSLKIEKVNFITGSPPGKKFKAMVKIRYNFREMPADIIINSNKTADIIFNRHQKAITPGQSAVFYIGNNLIGGGIIKS